LHAWLRKSPEYPPGNCGGLGRDLLVFAKREAIRCGLTRMALVTHEVMAENRAIYAHLGYTEVGRWAEYGYRRIYMDKRLPG
jgi:hypothetical protein